jgi:hypothetical protein
MRTILFFLLSVLFISCEKDEVNTFKSGQDLLVGSWSGQVFQDSIEIYTRTNRLPKDAYGFSIDTMGVFREHKNIGWCGTPPVAYGDFDGSWSRENDSLINIEVGYWGGTMQFKMKILSIDEHQLKLLKSDFIYPENPSYK